jgi:hypothetical protein
MTMTQFAPASHRLGKLAIVCLGVAIIISATPVRADVTVEGSIGSARVQADKVPLSEVLAALETAFGLRYRTSVALDRTITGSLSGPLARIIGHLLDGYDYVIKTAPDTMEIAVVGRQGPNNTVSAATANPTPGWRSSIGNVRPTQAAAPAPRR